MLAVPADAAALLHPVILGQRQRRLGDNAGNRLEPLRLQAGGIDRDPASIRRALGIIDREHLAGEGPEIVDCGLRAAVALFGAVAEPDHPFGGMPK